MTYESVSFILRGRCLMWGQSIQNWLDISVWTHQLEFGSYLCGIWLSRPMNNAISFYVIQPSVFNINWLRLTKQRILWNESFWSYFKTSGSWTSWPILRYCNKWRSEHLKTNCIHLYQSNYCSYLSHICMLQLSPAVTGWEAGDPGQVDCLTHTDRWIHCKVFDCGAKLQSNSYAPFELGTVFLCQTMQSCFQLHHLLVL